MKQEEFNTMLQIALAQGMPGGYYSSAYSGEEMDALLDRVDSGDIILPSSASGSTKKFRLTVDDAGALSTREVTE